MLNFSRFNRRVKNPPITLKDIAENGRNWDGIGFHGELAQQKLHAVCNRPPAPMFEGTFKHAEKNGAEAVNDVFNTLIDFHGNDVKLMTTMTLILAAREIDTQYSGPEISHLYGKLYNEAILFFGTRLVGSELAYFLDKNYIHH